MPKAKEKKSGFYSRVRQENPNVFRADDSVLFCLLCDIDVKATQMSQVKQHLVTAKHLAAIERKKLLGATSRQSLLTTLSETTDRNRKASVFTMDLAKCFLQANIPLHKIRHGGLLGETYKVRSAIRMDSPNKLPS